MAKNYQPRRKAKKPQRNPVLWRSQPATQSQLILLARFGMTAHSKGDAFDKLNRLKRNDWKLPEPAKFVDTQFPVLPGMAKEEPCDDAARRGIA